MQAVVIPVIKVAGIALSAKSAYEGVKEGNWLKAVIGAVGAYYGLNSMAGGAGASDAAANKAAGAATQTTTTAGASATDKIAAELASATTDVGAANLGTAGAVDVASGGFSLVPDAAREATKAGADIAASSATSVVPESATQYLAEKAGETVAAEAGKQATGGLIGGLQKGAKNIMDVIDPDRSFEGLIGKAGEFANKNPAITQAGLQFVGGYMQGEAEQDMMDEQERLYKERMKRMGTPGDVGSAASIDWNPQAKRFETRA